MSSEDQGLGTMALRLGRIQMTGCFSESVEEAVDVVIDALLELELADRDRKREQRCRACNGQACDEGCGRCDQSPSVAGPNAHRWCSRCSGRGVEPEHDHCPCGCGAHMGCFLYDEGEATAHCPRHDWVYLAGQRCPLCAVADRRRLLD